jgi:hypothetical protein
MNSQRRQRHFFNTLFLAAVYSILPQTANAQQASDANCPAGYVDGVCYTWESNPNMLEATCTSQGAQRPDLCYSYYQINCQRGFTSACWMVNTANTNWNYYVEILYANTACANGYQDYCQWVQAQNIPQ